MSSSHSILTVESLGIRRSERWLFRGLSFQLSGGEVLQIVGQNGAGKTSLMRALCDLLTAREGKINWCEVNDLPCIPIFLGHLPAVKPELTVLENLLYHPLGGKFIEIEAIEEAINEVDLIHYMDTPARQLSAGQIRRVGLARLLLADTKCWVLDEPFTSLDVEGCAWLESKITDFTHRGGAVLLTSHQPINLSQTPRILEIKPTEFFMDEQPC
ncbi:MAG: heme ABC transporter ATP-binding protein CcmA [Gammaproteobacteria bacterium]|nr:MAG: heme ABC transporter ATP-binding protein CcmA [Gammaproteobacteria bacterium]